jgi:hypothetical protein
MKTYQIIITEFEEKEVVESEYQRLTDNKESDNEYGYVEHTVKKEVSTEIYRQKKGGELELKSIIDAFNKESHEPQA